MNRLCCIHTKDQGYDLLQLWSTIHIVSTFDTEHNVQASTIFCRTPYIRENELITAISIKWSRTKISCVNCICTKLNNKQVQFRSVQSLSRARLFATPWIAACQASLSITISRSSLRLTSIESVMPSSVLKFHKFPIGSGGLVAKSCPTLVTPWTVSHQAPMSMGFPRQEYWSGLPFPPLLGKRISPTQGLNLGLLQHRQSQVDSLLTELPGKPLSP